MSKSKEPMIEQVNPYNMPLKEPTSVKVKRFLYNRETGAFLGRTASSWCKILIFYLIFYFCLAVFWFSFLWLFHLTLDPRIPKYKLEDSLIGTNPGMGFRPMPNDSNALSTLIWYRGTARENYAYWVETLQEFLDVYRTPGKTPGRGQNIFKCSYDQPPPPGKVCDIDVRLWNPCTYEENYGYHLQQPCIFIKLNKIYNWRPEYYNKTSELPEQMPQSLKDAINKTANDEGENALNTVWVSCEGESPADVENIGPVEYYPKPGFPGYFFPYENSEGYLSPLVAVKFKHPRNGILINIECRAWAKNIGYDRRDKIGVVHFELMID
ncbi:sodium/potassium-transporting ATPase subunit beta-2-like [Macrosteles quadrilineatus]|uniref:sodium/potassium-transporting ATPase subunit beta-2-like n=1 Tax=Macrosteles quadrilineatus TaxID=74068 RepID=UPI0023E2BDC6|nr:sodium/potassium-transporting ATPase subunit beta-2-like [Macrosteles quadrilineatus]